MDNDQKEPVEIEWDSIEPIPDHHLTELEALILAVEAAWQKFSIEVNTDTGAALNLAETNLRDALTVVIAAQLVAEVRAARKAATSPTPREGE